mmetsp:Transcript_4722/g.8912  ORF Transcript_4722/g.8912 Transcript_4722/m.8912 type:complete len:567 (-) Transcript_4722:968-2668(-)
MLASNGNYLPLVTMMAHRFRTRRILCHHKRPSSITQCRGVAGAGAGVVQDHCRNYTIDNGRNDCNSDNNVNKNINKNKHPNGDGSIGPLFCRQYSKIIFIQSLPNPNFYRSVARASDTSSASSREANTVQRKFFRRMTTNSADESHGHFHGQTAKSNSNSKDANAKMRLTTLRLYRMLQRSCKDLVPAEDGTILLQKDIHASDWGKHHFHDNDVDGNDDDNDNDDDDDDDDAEVCATTKDQTNALIRLFLLWNSADPDDATGIVSKLNDWYDELVLVSGGLRFRTRTRTRTRDGSKNPHKAVACWTTPRHLRETVRFAFRSSSKIYSLSSQQQHPTTTTTLTPTELQAFALSAIRMMQEQNTLWKQSSVSTTSDGLVRVTATSRCLGTVSPVSFAAPSSALDPKHRFAYRIRVENVSLETTVQLLGRYWHIAEESDDNNDGSSPLEPIEVDAPYTGAVGQLPVLRPGQAFEYVSGTDLATPAGTMKGHFYMATVPEKTKSAKSGDDVVAVSYQGSARGPSPSSSSSGKIKMATAAGDVTSNDNGNSSDTRLFRAAVKPFRFRSFEK